MGRECELCRQDEWLEEACDNTETLMASGTVFRNVLCMMEGGPTAWTLSFGCRHPEMVVKE